MSGREGEWRQVDEEVRRAVAAVLGERVGREAALSRGALVAAVRREVGKRVSERVVRAAVNALRKDGVLICSTGGRGGGYWMARDRAEALAFLEREVRPRIRDLAAVERAMSQAVLRRWGQPSLFEFSGAGVPSAQHRQEV